MKDVAAIMIESSAEGSSNDSVDPLFPPSPDNRRTYSKEVLDYLNQVDLNRPWAAIRLKNGNTLITDEKDILTREENPAKETVWELRREDIPEDYRFINTQSWTRLANQYYYLFSWRWRQRATVGGSYTR